MQATPHPTELKAAQHFGMVGHPHHCFHCLFQTAETLKADKPQYVEGKKTFGTEGLKLGTAKTFWYRFLQGGNRIGFEREEEAIYVI